MFIDSFFFAALTVFVLIKNMAKYTVNLDLTYIGLTIKYQILP